MGTVLFKLAPFYLLGGSAFTCFAIKKKNITIIKVVAAAGPAVNAYLICTLWK